MRSGFMPVLTPVASADDPRLEPYRAVRDRDLLDLHDGFMAEGEVILRVLARSCFHRAESVLLAEKRAEPLAPVLALLPADTPVYVAPQPVLDAVAGFHLHRGVLAFGRRGPALDADALTARFPAGALIVALFGVGNHDNMGGVFRNAAAFGADAVLLDEACCDPLYRKSIRVSVGAALLTPFARLPPDADPVAWFEAAGLTPLALSPSGAETLAEVRRPDRACLLLGSEGPGLPPSLLARARTVRIPMSAGFDSLNVAVASGIALHHLVAARTC